MKKIFYNILLTIFCVATIFYDIFIGPELKNLFVAYTILYLLILLGLTVTVVFLQFLEEKEIYKRPSFSIENFKGLDKAIKSYFKVSKNIIVRALKATCNLAWVAVNIYLISRYSLFYLISLFFISYEKLIMTKIKNRVTNIMEKYNAQ